jgi:uncharacterized membrane protein
MIREEEAMEMNCTVEEAIKMVISGGAVIPKIPLNIPDGSKQYYTGKADSTESSVQ